MDLSGNHSEVCSEGFMSHCHGLWEDLDAHSIYHRHCQKAAGTHWYGTLSSMEVNEWDF